MGSNCFWDGRKQFFSVFSLWMVVNLLGISCFNDLSGIHHHDAITDITNHRKIMRNEDSSEAEFFFQVVQQDSKPVPAHSHLMQKHFRHKQ
jgi:hypothetical protein